MKKMILALMMTFLFSGCSALHEELARPSSYDYPDLTNEINADRSWQEYKAWNNAGRPACCCNGGGMFK